jgi:hypothetical protein
MKIALFIFFFTRFNQKGYAMKQLSNMQIAFIHGGYNKSLLPKPATPEVPHFRDFKPGQIGPKIPIIPREFIK